MGIFFPRECLVEQGPSALFTFSSSCLLCELDWIAPVTVTYVTMTYINRMRGVVALGFVLGFALFTSPGVLASGVSLLNCGEAEVTIESLFYTAEDGWVVPGQPIWESVDVPAGSNSDLLSVVEDSAGSFYFWLLSEVPVVIDGVVPKQIELEGTTFTAYEVNANDFSNVDKWVFYAHPMITPSVNSLRQALTMQNQFNIARAMINKSFHFTF